MNNLSPAWSSEHATTMLGLLGPGRQHASSSNIRQDSEWTKWSLVTIMMASMFPLCLGGTTVMLLCAELQMDGKFVSPELRLEAAVGAGDGGGEAGAGVGQGQLQLGVRSWAVAGRAGEAADGWGVAAQTAGVPRARALVGGVGGAERVVGRHGGQR